METQINKNQWTSISTLSCLFLIISLLLIYPAIYFKFTPPDSGFYNNNWALGFSQELLKGKLYPRWLPTMNDGMGSPVFYYYAPLPFYLIAPFIWLLKEPNSGVLLGSGVVLGLSGIAAFIFLTDFVDRKIALLASILYMIMPYHLIIDIYIRGAIGEQASYIFIPLALTCYFRREQHCFYLVGLALAIAGLVLSHIPSTILFLFVIGLIACLETYSTKTVKPLLIIIPSSLLGLGTAGVYLIPAFSSLDLIRSDLWKIHEPAAHYIGAYKGSFEFILFFIFLISLSIFSYGTVLAVLNKKLNEIRIMFILGSSIIFLVSPLAIIIWKIIEPLKIIQFPWRLLIFFDLSICVMLSIALKNNKKFHIDLTVIILSLFIFFSFTTYSLLSFYKSNPAISESRDALQQLMIDPFEYRPNCSELHPSFDQINNSTVFKRAEVMKNYFNETQSRPDTLRVFYYPFLEVRKGDVKYQTSCQKPSGLIKLDPIPNNLNNIEVLPIPLSIERTGLACSIVSLLVLISMILIPMNRNLFSPRR